MNTNTRDPDGQAPAKTMSRLNEIKARHDRDGYSIMRISTPKIYKHCHCDRSELLKVVEEQQRIIDGFLVNSSRDGKRIEELEATIRMSLPTLMNPAGMEKGELAYITDALQQAIKGE